MNLPLNPPLHPSKEGIFAAGAGGQFPSLEGPGVGSGRRFASLVWGTLQAVFGGLLILGTIRSTPAQVESANEVAPSRYETRRDHDPNGIGKFYLGREIAHVMGHLGADWLERPEREDEEKTSLMVEALRLKFGDFVADIGAGTGYLSWRMAQRVGEKGRVYGVDIQQEMLDLMSRKSVERGITNIIPVLGAVTETRLPTNVIDLAIMVDVYHEFSHPFEMMQSICASLKPGGRVVFVEFRAEDPLVPIKRVHKMTEAQVKKEAAAHPLEWEETIRTLPWQHLIVFRKKE